MALATAIQGARHTGQEITWLYSDGTAVDLTAATVTGFKKDVKTGKRTALDGTFNITDAAAGVFTWVYGISDVAAAGSYEVQFVATYGAGDVEKTQIESWKVLDAIDY